MAAAAPGGYSGYVMPTALPQVSSSFGLGGWREGGEAIQRMDGQTEDKEGDWSASAYEKGGGDDKPTDTPPTHPPTHSHPTGRAS